MLIKIADRWLDPARVAWLKQNGSEVYVWLENDAEPFHVAGVTMDEFAAKVNEALAGDGLL